MLQSNFLIPISILVVLYIIYTLFKITKKAYMQDMEEAAKEVSKLPLAYLSIASIWMTWRRTGINFYLPNINPFQLTFHDLKKGDFSQSVYLLIGTDEVEVYQHDFEAKNKFKAAVHVAIAEVEVNRNGVVTITPVPMEKDEISDIHMHVQLNRVPNGIYRNAKEMLDAV